MAISTVVSSFELLVKPLVQPAADILGAGRTIIQGYFLTISNLNTSNAVTLRVNFRAQSPDINSRPLLAFFDVTNVNAPLVPSGSSPNRTYTITVPAGDTGLFLLQPDVTQGSVVTNADTEIRGYVTVSLAAPFGSNSYNLLLTPQHRGTFLPKGFVVGAPLANPDFDQLAYSLPTASGGSQVTLTQISFPTIPPILANPLPELASLDPELLQIIQQNPNALRELVTPNGSAPNGNRPALNGGFQQAMNQVFERLETLEQLNLR